ncbi:MAG TPA: cupin domain-containing protein [Usitatibacter sp.]|nr:cupin domain-containing protein [Usitatibacter sp.]
MAIHHAAPGERIELYPKDGGEEPPGSVALIRDEHFEVFRLVMEQGKQLPEHEHASLITIQCLRGRVQVTMPGREEVLSAGTMIYLASGERHGLHALEDSSVLVTMLVARE